MKDDAPRSEVATLRARLRAELEAAPATARELSTRLGSPEKEIVGHLEHLARSLAAKGLGLVIEPAACGACGFAFVDRRRLAKPSRCPRCKSERIEPPVFRIS